MNYYLILSDGAETGPSKEQLGQLEIFGTATVIHHTGKFSEILDQINDSDDVVIGIDPDSCEWDLEIEPILNLNNIKAICTQSTSFDWVKPDKLKEKGIIVCNLAGFSTDSVAEYAMCMAIEGAKRLPLHLKNNWNVDWKAPVPMLLKDNKLGVVGLGKIGTRIAEIAKGIGMEVFYWSKNTRDDRFSYLELDDLFRQVDVLIPAFAENEETKVLVTKDRLDLMNERSIVVGLNRIKDICNEDYIIEKVRVGKLGGYAFEGDNAKPYSEYKGNVWAVPPLAWYTRYSLEEMNRIWIENMVALGEGNPQNVVSS